ncbi:MAG: protein kinase, partial [Pseudomonadota bacterium]
MTDSEPTRVAGLGLTIPPGTRLNGIFEIERQIGSGGMGMVYRAHNVETRDAVAIKIVRAEMADNPQVIALFRREAAVLHRLLHDAIVRYYLFSSDKDIGRPYLATEFVDGTPLSQMIDRAALPRKEVLSLAERLADGLQAAHDLSIFHRDISPDNIILPERDVTRAKIIDFGIAKAASVGGGTVIGDSIAGKFDYMSPEQLGLYGAAVDGRSDIYSLGIVLSEAIRGRGLDMGGTQLEVVEKRRKVPDIGDIDTGVRSLLTAMMQPKPDDRIQTMAEVAERARALRTGKTKPASSGGIKKIAAGVVVAAAVGGGAAWYLTQDSSTPFEPERGPPPLQRQDATADPSQAVPPVLEGGFEVVTAPPLDPVPEAETQPASLPQESTPPITSTPQNEPATPTQSLPTVTSAPPSSPDEQLAPPTDPPLNVPPASGDDPTASEQVTPGNDVSGEGGTTGADDLPADDQIAPANIPDEDISAGEDPPANAGQDDPSPGIGGLPPVEPPRTELPAAPPSIDDTTPLPDSDTDDVAPDGEPPATATQIPPLAPLDPPPPEVLPPGGAPASPQNVADTEEADPPVLDDPPNEDAVPAQPDDSDRDDRPANDQNNTNITTLRNELRPDVPTIAPPSISPPTIPVPDDPADPPSETGPVIGNVAPQDEIPLNEIDPTSPFAPAGEP